MTTIERAVSHYGADCQYAKLCEECGELIAAIAHFMQDRDTRDHVAEEIADVTIMLEQMGAAFDINPLRVKWWIDRKLERLEARMKNENRD